MCRFYRRVLNGAAVAQHLPAAHQQDTRNSQSISGLPQGPSLRSGCESVRQPPDRHRKCPSTFIHELTFKVFMYEHFSLFSVFQMEGISNMKDDMRRHLRAKLKSIYTKLIRKFG